MILPVGILLVSNGVYKVRENRIWWHTWEELER